MSADDRDWYRDRAKRVMNDHYYNRKEVRVIGGAQKPLSNPWISKILVWSVIGTVLFFVFKSFNSVPRVTALKQTASMLVHKNPRGSYESLGSINGHPVTFIIDTGTSLTSVPGALAKPLGIKSCEPHEFISPAGPVFGCVATVPELVIGPFSIQNIQIAIMPAMDGPALLGMNILSLMNLNQQQGSTLHLSARKSN